MYNGSKLKTETMTTKRLHQQLTMSHSRFYSKRHLVSILISTAKEKKSSVWVVPPRKKNRFSLLKNSTHLNKSEHCSQYYNLQSRFVMSMEARCGLLPLVAPGRRRASGNEAATVLLITNL
jgi:hypothetical protein